MKTLLSAATALLILTIPAWAASRTVTLSIPGMSCAACPITVKKALMQVDGVSKVDIDLEKREATVSFDDEKTSVEALTKATTEAGYPTTVKES